METMTAIFTILLAGFRGVRIVLWVLGIRVIPSSKVGVVEKLWSLRGLLRRCGLVGACEQTGLLPEILPGGVYFFYFPWQYRVHKLPTVEAGRGTRVAAASVNRIPHASTKLEKGEYLRPRRMDIFIR